MMIPTPKRKLTHFNVLIRRRKKFYAILSTHIEIYILNFGMIYTAFLWIFFP